MSTVNLDDIPKESLVSLLKRKERDLQTAQQRLAFLESEVGSSSRALQVLREDRRSFQSLCDRLSLPDTTLAFEKASAQEEPVDIDEIVQIDEDGHDPLHNFFPELREFCEMIFPNDPEIRQSLNKRKLNMSLLRDRWLQYEDEQARSIQAVTDASQSTHMLSQKRIETLSEENSELKATIDRLNNELTESANHQTQIINDWWQTNKCMHSKEIQNMADTSNQQKNSVISAIQLIISELQSSHQSHINNLIHQSNLEIQTRSQDSDRITDQMGELLVSQESDIAALQQQISRFQEERGSLKNLEALADRQAARDVEISSLKLEIERLKSGSGLRRSGYLTNILIKWAGFVRAGDPKQDTLVPVISDLLGCNQNDELALRSKN